MSSFYFPHLYPEDVLPIAAAIWWRDNYALFLRVLLSPKYRQFYFGSNTSQNLLIYPPECNRMESNLNGRKPRRHGDGVGSGNDKPATFRWINITLTDQDLDILGQETASLEQLSLAFVQLGVRGLGLAIKYDRSRATFVCSIYGSDSTNNMQPCGVSGQSSDLRDALLVSLFRFNNRLQGSFDGSTAEDNTIQPRRFQ